MLEDLNTKWAGKGEIAYEAVMDSTNIRTKEMARNGAPHGSLAVCDHQIAGRGRMTRRWETPAGEALTQTLLLRPKLPLEQAQLCTFAAALAAAKAIEEVGTVRRVSFTYCQYSSRYDAYKRGVVENAFNPALCNGSLMDIGVYCIHALVALFGMPEKVCAVANRLDNGLDSQGGAICVYPGMLAELSWSKIADSRRSNEIQGEQGTLLVDSITNPKDIVFVGRDKSRRVIHHDPDPEFFNMSHEIRSFMDFAEASGEEGRPWEDYNQVTGRVLALMDEIRSQTGIDFINLHQ